MIVQIAKVLEAIKDWLMVLPMEHAHLAPDGYHAILLIEPFQQIASIDFAIVQQPGYAGGRPLTDSLLQRGQAINLLTTRMRLCRISGGLFTITPFVITHLTGNACHEILDLFGDPSCP